MLAYSKNGRIAFINGSGKSGYKVSLTTVEHPTRDSENHVYHTMTQAREKAREWCGVPNVRTN